MQDNRQVIDVDSVIDVDDYPQTVDLTHDDETTVTMGSSYMAPRFPTRLYSSSTGCYDLPNNAKRKRPSWTPRPAVRNAPLESAILVHIGRPRNPALEVITLESDSEEEVEVQLTSPLSKKAKRDESDDDDRLPSPTINHSSWRPLPVKEELSDDERLNNVEWVAPTPPPPKERANKPPLVTRWQGPRSLGAVTNNMIGNFDRLRTLYCIKNRNALPTSWSVPKSVRSMALSMTSSFKHSPGSIMCIVQKEDWTIVGSICEGDNPDLPDEGPINPYNRDGSLIVWHRGQMEIMTGHRRRVERAEERWKNYSVNDIKFDPTSTSFVSSGGDRKIRSWQREPDSDEYVQDRVVNFMHKYTYVPHALAFKPGTRKLAVAEKRIHVYEDYDNSLAHVAFPVVPHAKEHSVGDMVWGCQSTDGFIFASSEPKDSDCFEGFHRAIDVEHGKMYKLDSDEAGDSIALTHDGDLLVHTSRGAGGKHPLRLYDVRRKEGCAIKSVDMEDFQSSIRGEINSISISRDGIYVALGRIDNRVHVYDARMLTRGVLYEFEHKGKSLTSPGGPSCGVVEVQWAWTEFSRLTLVSGGMDGCVRLWDPLTSGTNGIILAQVNSDIGHFSIGDCTEKEQQLVVGDCSGEVYMFNSSKSYIRPL